MSHDLKFWLKVGLFSILFFAILGYSYYKTKDIISGVRLITHGIEDGETTTDPFIELFGEAKRSVYINVNGREIFIDSDGQFSDQLILLPGYNIITIQALDKFGKEVRKVFSLVYKGNDK